MLFGCIMGKEGRRFCKAMHCYNSVKWTNTGLFK